MTLHADWPAEWLQTEARRITAAKVWRGVESQYASATTLLVDSLAEHELLEQLLEDSKPPAPALRARAKHFLLLTPFRYTPRHDSRFRPAGQGRHGLWYGARQLEAACAEVAYWRRRFIHDSAGLADARLVTHHTFFAAALRGTGIDLTAPPWNQFAATWTHDSDYRETHRLSDAAEKAGLALIQYASVRAPGGVCVAVFTPDALVEPRGGLDATRQAWVCTATRDWVMLRAEADPSLCFEWSDPGA